MDKDLLIEKLRSNLKHSIRQNRLNCESALEFVNQRDTYKLLAQKILKDLDKALEWVPHGCANEIIDRIKHYDEVLSDKKDDE